MDIKRRADFHRKELSGVFEEYRAILFLLGSLKTEILATTQAHEAQTSQFNRKTLATALQQAKSDVQRLREQFQVRLKQADLVAIFRKACIGPGAEGLKTFGSTVYFTKHMMEEWIRKYDEVLPIFPDLPGHARIGLAKPPEYRPVEIFLPEAIHFEEMAMLFNECAGALTKEATDGFGHIKRFRSLMHACYSATFHFLESYLNGIAFDFATRNAGYIKDKDFEVLLEWDFERERERFVSFREKLQQYPKILLRREHPPFTASNSPAYKILLGQAKSLRDAITHSSPRPSLKGLKDHKKNYIDPIERSVILALQVERKWNKEDYLSMTNFTSLTETVDAAVAACLQIENATNGYMKRLGYIKTRGSDGLFPKETFE